MYSDLCTLPCFCATRQYKYLKMYLIHQVNWYQFQCGINVMDFETLLECLHSYILIFLYFDCCEKCVDQKLASKQGENQGPALKHGDCKTSHQFRNPNKQITSPWFSESKCQVKSFGMKSTNCSQDSASIPASAVLFWPKPPKSLSLFHTPMIEFNRIMYPKEKAISRWHWHGKGNKLQTHQKTAVQILPIAGANCTRLKFNVAFKGGFCLSVR